MTEWELLTDPGGRLLVGGSAAPACAKAAADAMIFAYVPPWASNGMNVRLVVYGEERLVSSASFFALHVVDGCGFLESRLVPAHKEVRFCW